MPQILADAAMARQLERADGPVEVVNGNGTVIGVYTPARVRRSPYTREEVERVREEARKNPGSGKSLAEVLAYLNQLDGGKS